MMYLEEILYVFIIGLVGVVLWFTLQKESYFKKRGLRTVAASHIPLMGHMGSVLVGKSSLGGALTRVCKQFPEDKYVGFQEFLNPVIVVKDLELIKKISGKRDNESFMGHTKNMEWAFDSLLQKNMYFNEGETWEDERYRLGLYFTTKSVQTLYNLVLDSVQNMVFHTIRQTMTLESKERYVEVELKDFFHRHSSDLMSSVIFGEKVDSISDPKNYFYTRIKELSTFPRMNFWKSLVHSLFFKVFKFVEVSVSEEATEFLIKVIEDCTETRRTSRLVRKDMIGMRMGQAIKSQDYDEEQDEDVDDSDEFLRLLRAPMGFTIGRRAHPHYRSDLFAQHIGLYITGSDLNSMALSYVVYELAVNPKIQMKLRQEVDHVEYLCGGRIKYEYLKELKYMDMVILETLRKWPIFPRLDRVCTKSYNLPPQNASSSTPYSLKPGDTVWIPTHSIHHDPQYFENPETFDPERFSEENKAKLNPLAFMPFGVGPQKCLASKFAMMSMKTALFIMVREFDIIPTPRTQIPLKINNRKFMAAPDDGFWIALSSRDWTTVGIIQKFDQFKNL